MRMTFFAACLLVPSLALGQTLDDAAVARAIKAGLEKKYDHLVSSCLAKVGMKENLVSAAATGLVRTGAFDVSVSTNEGRIAILSAEAKRLYKPFTVTDAEPFRVPMVFVAVDPQSPGHTNTQVTVAAPIERVVLQSKTNDAVVQPETFHTEVVAWQNLLGATVEGNRAVATFSLETLKQLPPGDFDVLVITTSGERRCKVGKNDRARVFAIK